METIEKFVYEKNRMDQFSESLVGIGMKDPLNEKQLSKAGYYDGPQQVVMCSVITTNSVSATVYDDGEFCGDVEFPWNDEMISVTKAFFHP